MTEATTTLTRAELRQKEIKGVIQKIQGLIQEYGLTAENLGFRTLAPSKKLKAGACQKFCV